MTGDEPLVSVGIPTYNRAAELERAVRSVLAQGHQAVEVIVSDDASTDATPEVCARLTHDDPRVRVERQAHNIGHAANFQRVLDLARGEYFMWLSDDDHVAPDYVGRCLAALRADPSCAGVCGRGRYHRPGAEPVFERPMNLLATRPSMRVLSYFAQVTLNGPLYCVFPRAALTTARFREVMGGDWIVVGAMAARGRLRTLDDVHIERSAIGISSDATALASGEFRLRGARLRFPHVAIGWEIFRHVARGEPAYAVLGPWTRIVVGAVGGAGVALRFTAIDAGRSILRRARLLGPARALLAPLRSRRHR